MVKLFYAERSQSPYALRLLFLCLIEFEVVHQDLGDTHEDTEDDSKGAEHGLVHGFFYGLKDVKDQVLRMVSHPDVTLKYTPSRIIYGFFGEERDNTAKYLLELLNAEVFICEKNGRLFYLRMRLISTSSVFSREKREPRISARALAVSREVMQGMPSIMAFRCSTR